MHADLTRVFNFYVYVVDVLLGAPAARGLTIGLEQKSVRSSTARTCPSQHCTRKLSAPTARGLTHRCAAKNVRSGTPSAHTFSALYSETGCASCTGSYPSLPRKERKPPCRLVALVLLGPCTWRLGAPTAQRLPTVAQQRT
jgi:hypothetical protein